jgi:hypothetical protein
LQLDYRIFPPIIVGAFDPKPFEQFSAAPEKAFQRTHQEGFSKTAGPGQEILRFLLGQPIQELGLVGVKDIVFADRREIGLARDDMAL